jgi:hypothetical protein
MILICGSRYDFTSCENSIPFQYKEMLFRLHLRA